MLQGENSRSEVICSILFASKLLDCLEPGAGRLQKQDRPLLSPPTATGCFLSRLGMSSPTPYSPKPEPQVSAGGVRGGNHEDRGGMWPEGSAQSDRETEVEGTALRQGDSWLGRRGPAQCPQPIPE